MTACQDLAVFVGAYALLTIVMTFAWIKCLEWRDYCEDMRHLDEVIDLVAAAMLEPREDKR